MGGFKTLTQMVAQAQENLNRGDWDYLVGAADTEASLRRNRQAVESWTFRPRILNDVSEVSYATEFMGANMRIPVLLPQPRPTVRPSSSPWPCSDRDRPPATSAAS